MDRPSRYQKRTTSLPQARQQRSLWHHCACRVSRRILLCNNLFMSQDVLIIWAISQHVYIIPVAASKIYKYRFIEAKHAFFLSASMGCLFASQTLEDQEKLRSRENQLGTMWNHRSTTSLHLSSVVNSRCGQRILVVIPAGMKCLAKSFQTIFWVVYLGCTESIGIDFIDGWLNEMSFKSKRIDRIHASSSFKRVCQKWKHIKRLI